MDKFHQGHVLNKNGIHTCVAERLQQVSDLVEFMLIDDGVDRDIDPGAEAMGILAQRLDVADAVAGGSPGTKLRGTDIDGIGTMVNGSHATFQVPGRCQQLKRCRTGG